MSSLESEGYARLNPVSKKAMYVYNAIVIAVTAVFCLLLIVYASPEMGGAGAWLNAVLMILLAAVIAYCAAAPQIFHRVYGYRVTGDMIDVREGIIVVKRTVVPMERVHQVEVTGGPVNRAFGLRDVSITTAGGTARIKFLEAPVADKVAADLKDQVNAILRGRANE